MRTRGRVRVAVRALAAAAVLSIGAPATAQGTSADTRRWEIEGYGGLTRPVGTGDGTVTLPGPGAPIATSSPIFPSRQVSSWFFGDGAALVNAVNAEFGVPSAILPLDEALRSPGLSGGTSAVAGVRIRRRVSSRYSAEFSIDLLDGSAAFSDDFLAAVDATRASFVPAFTDLFSTGPFTNIAVDAVTGSESGRGRELAFTGAIVNHLGAGGGFEPYVALGGGVIAGLGERPSVSIEGRYRFMVDDVAFDETDRVTIRAAHKTALVGVVGGGIQRAVSDRWGVRVDGRVLIGRRATLLEIDASPSAATGTPADFIESFTAPAIQFSNNPSTGRTSTLGGSGLQGFEAFEGDGLQTRVIVTIGFFTRF